LFERIIIPPRISPDKTEPVIQGAPMKLSVSPSVPGIFLITIVAVLKKLSDNKKPENRKKFG
jgi:hypothetical protein